MSKPENGRFPIWELISITLITLLALYLRVGYPGINSFGFDEARVSHMALQMARGGQFAQMGMQSSTYVPNLPATVWIFAIPFLFTPDPLAANIFIGVIGATAVPAIWWLARQAWGAWVGLVVALLLAVSPTAVFYARGVWSQDLLIPLTTFWALTGVIGIAHKRNWALALHVFLAGFIFQIHFAGIPLILGTLWLGLRYRLWQHWKPVLIGGFFAFLALLPYVQIIWCCGAGAQQDWLSLLRQPSITNWGILQTLANVGTGSNWESLMVGADWQWTPPLPTLLSASWLILIVLIVAGFLLAGWRAWQFRHTAPDWESVLTTLLPIWVVIIPLYHFRFRTTVGEHYLLTAVPALLLLIGIILDWQRGKKWWMWSLTAVLVTIALIQTNTIMQALQITADQHTPSGMGTPLHYPRAAAQALQDGAPVALHTFDDNAAYSGDAATFAILFWNYPHRIVDGRSTILIPQAKDNTPVHLMATRADLPAWQEISANGLAENVQELPRRDGDIPFVATTLDNWSLPQFQPTDPIRLENGTQLKGWYARENNGIYRVFTMWQIVDPPIPGDYHQFNHFQDGVAAEPVAIHDTRLSSSAWQQGDTIITWVDFNPMGQDGPFWVDIGMYTWPDVVRTPRLNHDGDPLQPIRLGPFGE